MKYEHGPIEVKVPVPPGYREQLQGVEILFGKHRAPYFGLDIHAPEEAKKLWPGYRGIEEYAREVFPLEEKLNGMTWMNENGG